MSTLPLTKINFVKKIILTHMSQRYDENPKRLVDEARKVFKNTFIAKDLDVVEFHTK